MTVGEVCLIEAEDTTIAVDLSVEDSHLYKMNIITDYPNFSWGISDVYVLLYPNRSTYSGEISWALINYPPYTRFSTSGDSFIIGAAESFIESIISIKSQSVISTFSSFGYIKNSNTGVASSVWNQSRKWNIFGSLIFAGKNYKKIIIERVL